MTTTVRRATASIAMTAMRAAALTDEERALAFAVVQGIVKGARAGGSGLQR